jgi:hypothetical protein
MVLICGLVVVPPAASSKPAGGPAVELDGCASPATIDGEVPVGDDGCVPGDVLPAGQEEPIDVAGRTDGALPVARKKRKATFVLASFNVLGHKHSQRGGSKSEWAGGGKRITWALKLLDRHRVHVVGFQELQWPQKRRLLAETEGRWALFSKHGDPDNSIAWRTRRWSLVKAAMFTIPYFGGRPRYMPVVRLRDNHTGRDTVFVNVHNPADTRRHPQQDRYRAEAVRREFRVVRNLKRKERVPVFLTGDFNQREEVFCKLTRQGLLSAAAGGRHRKECRPPDYDGIDWIFGTRRAAFLDHDVVRDRLVRRTTDHPLVLATVRR